MIDCSQGVELLENREHHHEGEDHDDHDHGHWDPHYWMDPERAGQMVANLQNGLAQADPEHASVYQENGQKAALLLSTWDSDIRDLLAEEGMPEITGLITFHDGFQYFAAAYDLPLLAAIEEEAGSEASAKEINEITALVKEKNIPVIFTAITDPVGAHLDAGNITGTSDALPVEGQLQLIRALQPDADTIGIVYTTSEANSVYSISVYEELATDYGFTIDAVGVTSQAEVTQAVDTLLSHGVDCLSNLTDNNVVGVLGAILEKTDEAGIPVYGSEVEQVKLGCVGGAGLDYIQLGIQTGLMAAKVLTGEAACEDLPYETIENYGLYINSDAAAELGITIPDDIAQEAQECAE